MTEPLSPAALATWNAFLEHSEWEVTPVELNGVAAALRAAADQVLLMRPHGGRAWSIEQATAYDAITKVADFQVAIAAELEGGND
jgi:hypothetical protein